ncbi:MAG: beta-lactamase family protein [Pseudomonadales bacterium]|nr:beta-lactamase family protein [Pseudomonadales bacterium]MBO7006222.1 beta-lactamase family protein [Pseudomonadales bacterium]
MSHLSLDLADGKGVLLGTYDTKFEPVISEFVRNFEEREEQGASLCFNVDGETVVDVWGGRKHPKQEADWQNDTLSIVHSLTKAAVSICVHILVAEGRLGLHEKVTRYWPEFGQNGKEDVTVEMMLNHTVGLSAARDRLPEGAFLDFDFMADVMAKEAPWWRPGTRHGYQMATYGWTAGELVRRASGMSLGEFFRDRLADPLDLDFYMGLPESEHHRVARMMRWTPNKAEPVTAFTLALLNDRKSLQSLAFMNNGKHKTDQPESYLAEYGAAGGLANARGAAGMFAPFANGGGDFVDRVTLERMQATSAAGEDVTLLCPTRFSLGFMLSMDNRHRETGALETIIMGKHAFGHAGAGGSVGFADTECRLGFGYTMNKMGAGILLNLRGQSLIDETYRCLGYTTDEPGYWIR